MICKRDWLNPLGDDDTGSIALTAISPKYEDFHDAQLTIRDCGKQVTLDFSCHVLLNSSYKEKQIKQRLKKAALFKKYAELLEKNLQEALQVIKQNPRKK